MTATTTTSTSTSTSTSTTTTTAPAASSFKTWRQQLVTVEDPAHLHKTLGVACLVSYAWRFSMAGASDMGFATHPELTLPTLLLHWSLTLSAFAFNIPRKRIKTGDRIWPEYRLHALVFLSRSLAILALYHYEQVYHSQEPMYQVNFAIVMATLFFADWSSWSVGEDRSGSIRDLEAHPAVKFFFSFMQFGATSGCLYGLRRFSLVFYFTSILQFTPFLMTLRRKNFLSKPFILTMYGLMLAGGVVVVIYEHGFYAELPFNSFLCQGVIINLSVLLRLGPRIPVLHHVQDNKYLLWLCMGLLLRRIRPIFEEEHLSKETVIICQFLRISMLALGVWKGFLRDSPPREKKLV